MLALINIILSGVALLFLLPVTVVFIEVLLAIAATEGESTREGMRRRLTVLMPAHDESATIADTIRSVLPQLDNQDRLLVVADNCSDNTAAIARTEGAEVIVRNDAFRRGKGYALDFGIRNLEADPPEIVIVIDADCQVTAGSIDRLAHLCTQTSRPTQALYLMRGSEEPSLKTRIAQFAWIVKNQVRPTGLHRLGLPCQLMGTGMAFPWRCIRSAALATGHIVEDLKLGLDLARDGEPPLFCPEAIVTSTFPTSSEGIRDQRTRWEHGHLGVILAEAPRLLLRSIIRFDANLFALVLDLSVPPLALLTLQVMLIWLIGAALYIVTRERLPLGIATTAVVLLGLSTLLSWRRYGRGVISIGELPLAMKYVLRKIPIYIKFMTARQVGWIRSKRDKTS